MKSTLNFIEKTYTSIVFIVIGILFLVKELDVFFYIFPLFGFLIILSTYLKLINIILFKKKINIKIYEIILNSIIGILLIAIPKTFAIFSTHIFGLYAFIQSLIGFINAFIYHKDHLKGKSLIVFNAIITFLFSLLFLYSPTRNMKYFAILIGIYLIFYGVMSLFSYFYPKIPIKIPLPIIFTMMLPKILMKKIEKELIKTTDDINGDLEILIHLAKNGSAGMGHVEFAFEGKIYSYGCYNYHSRKLFNSIGDGIFGVFDHDSYIKYCVEEKERYILSYGLTLTEKEKKKLNKTIEKFLSTNTERWYPDEALYDNKLISESVFNEMANHIYRKAKGKFYRFIKGKYKTFFVLRTNCVAGTDEILSQLGIKLVKLEGIITPGTYYKFLDDEFKKINTNVISKKIYDKELVKKLKYKYQKKQVEKI